MDKSKADRLAERSNGKGRTGKGLLAAHSWRQLTRVAHQSQEALSAIRDVALDPGHPRCADASDLLLRSWSENRTLDTPFGPPIHEALLRLLFDVASMRDHPRRTGITDALTSRWFETGNERMAALAIQSDLNPSPDLPGTAVLALKCALVATQDNVGHLLRLIAHPDQRVRSGTAAAIESSDGAARGLLWNAAIAEGSGGFLSPLTRLLLIGGPPDSRVIALLWKRWRVTAEEALLEQLIGWPPLKPTAEIEVVAMVASTVVLQAKGRLPRIPVAANDLVAALTSGPHPLDGYIAAHLSTRQSGDSLDDFCDHAISSPSALRVCTSAALAPKDPVRRARFFLLTEQISQYRQLDPDGSLLALIYASATHEDRQQLLALMRKAGQLDLMRIVVGGDRRSRIQSMTGDELDYLVAQLEMHGEWRDLWSIAQDVALPRAINIALRIDPAHAHNAIDDEGLAVVAELRRTSIAALQQSTREMRERLPPAVQQSRVHFHGRVNDVAFAPDQPMLAAAGTKSVVGLIDLRTGRLTERWQNFTGSVGRVVHAGNGVVVGGERTNGLHRACAVTAVSSRGQSVLQRELGSVTDLALLPDGAVLASSRTGTITCHVLGADGLASTRATTFRPSAASDDDWPRALGVSPDGSRVSVLGQSITVLGRDLTQVHAVLTGTKAIHYAAFVTRDLLVAGGMGGHVTLYRHQGRSLSPVAQTSLNELVGLSVLESRSQIVAASPDGSLHFLDGSSLKSLARLEPPPRHGRQRSGSYRATSLHTSHGDDFLAIGYVEGSGGEAGFCDIYDLRVGRLPLLADTPLALATPSDLGTVRTARGRLGSEAGGTDIALGLLDRMLTYRFRFDIEISDLATLKAGEYDIYLE